jgi:ribosomal protein S17E
MEQIDLLIDKGISVTVLKNKGKELRKRWGEAFANDISKNQKRQIFYRNFLWHIFSYEVLSCKEGHKASVAFNLNMKDECYIFYHKYKNALLLENAGNLTSEDINNEIGGYIHDAYVVDKDFSWTYIRTHEDDCGPYFYKPVKDPIFFN